MIRLKMPLYFTSIGKKEVFDECEYTEAFFEKRKDNPHGFRRKSLVE